MPDLLAASRSGTHSLSPLTYDRATRDKAKTAGVTLMRPSQPRPPGSNGATRRPSDTLTRS